MNPWLRNLLCGGGGGGGGGPVLPPTGRTMLANLTSSLILDEGTGGPTWSRATKAWGFNELGYLEELASGCAFFGGARLVRNTVRTKSEDFSNVAWAKGGGITTPSANVVVCANGTSPQYLNQETGSTSLVVGTRMAYSHRVKRIVGGVNFLQIAPVSATFGSLQFVNISLIDGSYLATGCSAIVTAVSADTFDVTIFPTSITAGGDLCHVVIINAITDVRLPSFIGDGIKSFELLRAWSVDVTNYDASYIPEYVSVGAEASPYFGAGIDGAKYFETDWQGAPIAAANLLGFRREASATNNILRSRRFSNPNVNDLAGGSAWLSSQTVGAELITNGGFDSDTVWAKAAPWTIAAGVASCTSTTAGTISQGLSGAGLVSGKTYVITWTITRSAGSIIVSLGSPANDTGAARNASGTYTETIVCGANTTLYFYAYGNFVGTLDDVSIKECAVQITFAQGLDGGTNTATTLTASDTDATILQSTTIASAARCASAYVKRRTGTGTISFTQDGGSSWTDITSLINSSTWSRVQITATLANPSVGFKISTSGDAIDVDCVQNEAGAVATSPIVTTTAAVTRNADSLTYQTASNIDFATGTMFCELYSPAMATYPPVFSVGSGSCSLITDDPTSWRINDGTTSVAILGGLSNIRTGKRKRAASWGGATKTVCGDGVAPTSGAFDGSFGSGAAIEIGNSLNGYIGPVAIWNYKMTDAELQALTT